MVILNGQLYFSPLTAQLMFYPEINQISSVTAISNSNHRKMFSEDNGCSGAASAGKANQKPVGNESAQQKQQRLGASPQFDRCGRNTNRAKKYCVQRSAQKVYSLMLSPSESEVEVNVGKQRCLVEECRQDVRSGRPECEIRHDRDHGYSQGQCNALDDRKKEEKVWK